ncbi:MAG: hypothetical protein L0Y68_07165 [Candidatus Dadabacteria bacterium]|nr:hypothetical protein [Candidatus Dadabacteria bacterium]
MDIEKEIKRRLRAQQLGTTYFSTRKINIWSEINREELMKWALAGVILTGDVLAEDAPGEVGHSLAQILAEKFNHNFDAYDKAIDAAYNAGTGGSSALHHLLDGQHSIWGALEAVKDEFPDDTFLQELIQAIEHLIRDLCSISGINPLFSMTRDTFEAISSVVAPLGISKIYLADALTINGVEVLGATMLIPAMLLGRKSLNTVRTPELIGSLIVSSIASANPLLLAAAGYAMYKCCKKRDEISWRQLCISAGKGALVTGIVTTVTSPIGGPVWIGLAASMATAIAVRAGIGKFEELWPQLWPAYQGVEQRLPSMIQQIDISALS